ncbi:Protein kinase superfamily protein [Forsythia ovata]|uniref:Protein kinase superfamily protein n=1 Tax=Forsythia ovata TaxID=205694 RepID=A0ABD1WIX3_9LAMI
MPLTMASVSSLMPVLCSVQTHPRIRKTHQKNINKNNTNAGKRKLSNNGGALENIAEVVKKDVLFLRTGLNKGLQWANKAFRIPQFTKSVEDLVWLRNVEDPQAAFLRFPSWPQPYYPELSGVDLFLADLKALEVYASYFYYLAKMWTKPLPEIYDPQIVTDYFSLRPHVVTLRLLEVFAAFASAAIKFQISSILSATDKDADENILKYHFGTLLKETMLNLGPTFIKVGQSLSTRPDIIGSETSKALSELHDQVPPFPRAEAMKIVEEELGSPVEKFFSYVSEEPVAAASFGQVYKGSTCDGFEVAVKVQRPNLHHVVVRDIYILRIGLGLLQKILKRKSDLRLYADELGKGLVGELDYNLEAANVSEFMEVHSRFPFIRVPKVFQHLSKKRVLTMEWMVGDSPSDLLLKSSEESKAKLLDLVKKGVDATLIQLLETGLLHADPHPGNLRYTSSGQIGFLDFGLLCQMEKKHQFAMLASILHIVNGDWVALVHDLTEMDVVRPGTNIRLVTMDLEDALGEVEFNNGIPDVKFSRVLGKIWSVAIKYHFRMPPYYTLVLRSLASLEGLAVAADPTFKTFEAAYPFVVQKLLIDNSAASREYCIRKGLRSLTPSSAQASFDQSANAVPQGVDVANLVLKLLPSENGAVLRRLLMTADGASLIRAVVSKEASFSANKFVWLLLIYCTSGCLKPGKSSQLVVARTAKNTQIGPSMISASNGDYQSFLSDRRLKIILLKALDSARKDPVLMLRFCWSSLVIFITATALACHRVLVSLSEAYLDRIFYARKQIAVGA